jgi:hypothetical protein
VAMSGAPPRRTGSRTGPAFQRGGQGSTYVCQFAWAAILTAFESIGVRSVASAVELLAFEIGVVSFRDSWQAHETNAGRAATTSSREWKRAAPAPPAHLLSTIPRRRVSVASEGDLIGMNSYRCQTNRISRFDGLAGVLAISAQKCIKLRRNENELASWRYAK